MNKWARTVIGALVRGGTVFLAYLLLCPAIWSRSVFEGFEIAIALAIAGGWRLDHAAAPVPLWVRIQILISAGFITTLVPSAVLLEALFGDGSVLATPIQQITFGFAVALAVVCWVLLRRDTRAPALADPDGDARRAAIRANIRHEIGEIERSAEAAPSTAPSRDDPKR